MTTSVLPCIRTQRKYVVDASHFVSGFKYMHFSVACEQALLGAASSASEVVERSEPSREPATCLQSFLSNGLPPPSIIYHLQHFKEKKPAIKPIILEE